MLIDEYEILVEVYRVVERRGGAVYRTEFVEERWVPMAWRGHTIGDEQFVTLSSRDPRPFTETVRRTS